MSLVHPPAQDAPVANPERPKGSSSDRRFFATFAPIPIAAFAVFIFYVTRDSTASAAEPPITEAASAYNTDMPDAIVASPSTKSEAYEQVRRDSIRRERLWAKDPHAADVRPSKGRLDDALSSLGMSLGSFNSAVDSEGSDASVFGSSGREPKASGHEAPARGRSAKRARRSPSLAAMNARDEESAADIDRALARLGGAAPSATPIPASGPAITPEDSVALAKQEQLAQIMEHALMLRHPELAEEELRRRSEEESRHLVPIGQASPTDREVRYFGRVPLVNPDGSRALATATPSAQVATQSVPINPSEAAAPADSMPPAPVPSPYAANPSAGFFDAGGGDDFTQVTAQAQVHSTTTITDGSTVKIRLLEDVYLAGERLPQHSFLTATARFSGDRIRLSVSSVNHRGNIYPVSLEAYDLDGQPGISTPGAVERRVAKRQASQSARSAGNVRVSSGNLAAQLAGEGADAIREVASAKIRVERVELKSGHRLILRNS